MFTFSIRFQTLRDRIGPRLMGPKMTDAELLGEVEELIRTMPPAGMLTHDSSDVLEWCGRGAAVMKAVGLPMGVAFTTHVSNLHNRLASYPATIAIQRLLHEARYSLRMQTVGPLSTAIGAGGVFDYFDEVRKLVETASKDLLFVDPYLDAEFVSRYLPHVKAGVGVRLLTLKNVAALVPAAAIFKAQSGVEVSVRASTGMHDRFVFVDGMACYQSGASFKDGAKRAPTTLTQITDAFLEVRKQYEDRWSVGTIHL